MKPATLTSAARFTLFILTALVIPIPAMASGSGGGEANLLTSIGISIVAATALAFAAHLLRQPLILAYIAAGVVIGPTIGFGWVASERDIHTISEIGLILLLFMIGLELDVKKLKEAGRALFTIGVLQFVCCAVLGIAFFRLMGFPFALPAAGTAYRVLGTPIVGGGFDLYYLAVCLALSSTAIVVKLLYGKFELDTLAGRLTLGVLVFQDMWAIVILGVQPNLADPRILGILWSFAKGGALVFTSLLATKYVLGPFFRKIAKLPELMLVASLGWCFLVCGLAAWLGISMEMGALIAGVSISTFPYNLDVIAKIVSIRDFFITLFFIALGMQIPNPLANPGLVALALIASGFLVLSRFATVFPILYALRLGNRVGLLTSINLAQVSEFSLVIAAIGLAGEHAHIGRDLMTLIVFVFVITSVLSTYMITFSTPLQRWLSRGLRLIGFRDERPDADAAAVQTRRELVLLGFYHTASSFLGEMLRQKPELAEKTTVVDFNPEVFDRLRGSKVRAVYGDISNLDTLHHAGIDGARVVISTIPDSILKGTDNLRLLRSLKHLCPQARVVVTAESILTARRLYAKGADYVLMPRLLTGRHLLEVLEPLMGDGVDALRAEQVRLLENRIEVLF